MEEAGVTYTSVTAIIFSDRWVTRSHHIRQRRPFHHDSTMSPYMPAICLQIVTAGDAFANFIDPAAPQPWVLHGRLVALVPTTTGLLVSASEQRFVYFRQQHLICALCLSVYRWNLDFT